MRVSIASEPDYEGVFAEIYSEQTNAIWARIVYDPMTRGFLLNIFPDLSPQDQYGNLNFELDTILNVLQIARAGLIEHGYEVGKI